MAKHSPSCHFSHAFYEEKGEKKTLIPALEVSKIVQNPSFEECIVANIEKPDILFFIAFTQSAHFGCV